MITRYAEADLPHDISGVDLNTKYPVRELQKPTMYNWWMGIPSLNTTIEGFFVSMIFYW
jgi:hypothetical protein